MDNRCFSLIFITSAILLNLNANAAEEPVIEYFSFQNSPRTVSVQPKTLQKVQLPDSASAERIDVINQALDTEWEKSISGIQQTAQDLIEYNDQLRAQYKFLDEQIEKLDAGIAKQQEDNKQLRATVMAKQSASANEELIRALEKKLSSKQGEVELLRKDIVDVKQRLENENRALQLRELQVNDLALEKKSLELEIQLRDQQLSPDLVAEDPRLVELHQQLREAGAQAKILEDKIKEIENLKVPTEEELASLKKVNEELEFKIEDKKKELKERARLKALDFSDKEQTLYQAKVDERQSLLKEIQTLKRAVHTSATTKIPEKYQVNQEDNKDLIKEMVRVDEKNQVVKEKIGVMKENVSILKDRVSSLRSQYSTMEAKRIREGK